MYFTTQQEFEQIVIQYIYWGLDIKLSVWTRGLWLHYLILSPGCNAPQQSSTSSSWSPPWNVQTCRCFACCNVDGVCTVEAGWRVASPKVVGPLPIAYGTIQPLLSLSGDHGHGACLDGCTWAMLARWLLGWPQDRFHRLPLEIGTLTLH